MKALRKQKIETANIQVGDQMVSAGRAWRVYRDRSQGYGRGRHVYI